jgi:signal transduction histidine kinase
VSTIPTLLEIILQEAALEYIILNSRFEVRTWSLNAPQFTRSPLQENETIFNCFPELIGTEEELENLLFGQVEKVHLAKINFIEGTETFYYTLSLKRLAEDGFVCLISDVSETTRLEQTLVQERNELSILRYRLEEQNNQLKELNQLKSSFLSIASHELRSPLSIIYGYMEILQDEMVGSITSKQKEFIQKIDKNITTMLQTINDLLEIDRLESGKIKFEPKSFNIVTLVSQITSNFVVEAQNRKHILEISNPDRAFQVFADANQTEQILTNYIGNAIKYTPNGGNIRISFEEQPSHILVKVSDNGIGIVEDEVGKVFQRFYRASNASCSGAGGSGLGLAIVRDLVERQGGQVWVESELGKGSIFSFSLPKP